MDPAAIPGHAPASTTNAATERHRTAGKIYIFLANFTQLTLIDLEYKFNY
jgi:hypothetical protein